MDLSGHVHTKGDKMDIQDIDRILREMTGTGIKEFSDEAEKWAKEVEQCKTCQSWAKLDKNGHCWAHKY